MYGLFKVATVGAVPVEGRPGIFSQVARAKWDSWSTEGNEGKKTKEEAETEYVTVITELAGPLPVEAAIPAPVVEDPVVAAAA